MPQLEIPDYGPQVFWLVVTFIVLLILMWSLALPRIASVLERRRKHIEDDLESAQKFKQDAEEAIKSYEASLAEA
ncbi:MAG: F0F1 ATP synthase subunit B', partial [Alphaproteobacteria bacterium]|nr:F0F1 ATP synthase subunit B' [Alphaproteobacteria bacterium]